MNQIIVSVVVGTILFLTIAGVGVLPGTVTVAALVLAFGAMLAGCRTPATGRMDREAPARPWLEGLFVLILVLLLASVLPLPPALAALLGQPRAAQQAAAGAALREASQLQMIPALSVDPWFAFTCSRAGTLRMIMLVAAVFGTILLISALTPAWKARYLRLVLFLGAAVAVGGYLSHWHYPEGNRLWWLFPVPPTRPGPVGGFINRNDFGGFLVLFCPAALALAFEDFAERRWFYGTVSAILLLILVFGIVGSLSRTSFVACVAALAGATGFCLLRLRRSRWSALLLGTALVLFISLLLSVPTIRTRLAGILAPTQTASVQTRLAEWRECLRAWSAYPILGVGANAVGAVYPQFRRTTSGGTLVFAENEYVQLLVEGGAAGVLLTAALIVVAWRRSRCNAATEPRSPVLTIAAGGALLGAAIQSLAGVPLRIPVYAIVMASLVGLLLRPVPLRWPLLGRLSPRLSLALPAAVALLAALLAAPAAFSMHRLDSHAYLQGADSGTLAQAIVWSPTSWQAWYYLGRHACARAGAGDAPTYRFGERCIARACAYDPNNYRLWYQLGFVRQRRNDAEGAQRAFVRAHELRSWLPVPPPEKERR